MRIYTSLIVSLCALIVSGSINAGSVATPREQACKGVTIANTIRARLAWDLACKIAPGVGENICSKGNPYPSNEEIKKNCIDCVLTAALGGEPCDESWGDPHLITRDGLRYSFHREGDYALIVADNLEVQIRLISANIGYTNGVAIRAGDHTVSIDNSSDSTAPVYINDNPVFMKPGDWFELAEPTTMVQKLENGYRIEITDYAKLAINGTRLTVQLDNRFSGITSGLLGDGDGDPSNDLQTAAGNSVDYRGDEFYGEFKEDWRRSDDASLFNSPFIYTTDPSDLSGQGAKSLADLNDDDRRQARATCLAAGVPLGAGLDECTFDVALTGDSSFVDSTLSLLDTLPQTLSPASLRDNHVSQISINPNTSVTPDVPSAGAGILETNASVDRYLFTSALVERQVLRLRSPCDGAVSLNVLSTSNTGKLTETALDCQGLVLLGTNIVKLDVFSTAGDTTDYSFDLLAETLVNLGALPIDQVIQGNLSAGEIAVGTLSNSAAGNTVYVASEQTSDCDVRWRVLRPNGLAETAFESACTDLGLIELTDTSASYKLEIVGTGKLSSYAFLLREPLRTSGTEIALSEVTLAAPTTTTVGSEVIVSWTGPNNYQDYISIALPEMSAAQHTRYSYLQEGSNEIRLDVPGIPGEYEIRYIVNSNQQILQTIPITVTQALASLSAPTTASAGSTIQVEWTGPMNRRDYISLANVDDLPYQYHRYSYLQEGSNIVELVVPGIPGEYELRYVVDTDSQTIASERIEVTAVSAQLSAPTTVQAGSTFEVQWSGPGNSRDYISIASPGEAVNRYESYRYVQAGASSIEFKAPSAPGNYEIRYIIDTDNQQLASIAIVVTE